MRRKKLSDDRHLKPAKRKRLEAAGWKVGAAKDFLGLTPEEATFVERKLKPRVLVQNREP